MKVTIRCDKGHLQIITYSNMVPKAQVEMFAAILDGRAFIHPVPPESQLCKCGICGAVIHAEVSDD